MQNKWIAVAVAIVAVCAMIVGCSINPSKFSEDQAQDLVDNLTYAKDSRTGLCFAMVASRKTGDTDQTGLGITHVPCEDVAEQLVK